MAFLTVLSLLLRQADKVLLSTLLPLSSFGYYSLAAAVAGTLFLVTGAISDVFYPRLSEVVSRGDAKAIARIYHEMSQLLSIILFALGSILAVFSEEILHLWTRDRSLIAAAPLVTLLAVGNVLNGLALAPYVLQLAHGKTRIQVVFNIAAVSLLVPLLFIFVPLFGAGAAAWIWLCLNSGYVLLSTPLVHSQFLRHETWRWYFIDLLPPAVASIAVTTLFNATGLLRDPGMSRIEAAIVLAFISTATLFVATVATPIGRNSLCTLARSFKDALPINESRH